MDAEECHHPRFSLFLGPRHCFQLSSLQVQKILLAIQLTQSQCIYLPIPEKKFGYRYQIYCLEVL